tara:strand:- start:1339 stop:1440 length:102 start_codon:yes stop_codon:yes gene_type:complete
MLAAEANASAKELLEIQERQKVEAEAQRLKIEK